MTSAPSTTAAKSQEREVCSLAEARGLKPAGPGRFLAKGVELEFETPRQISSFFGYYYTSPLSQDNRFLLAHVTDYDGRDLQVGDTASVGCYDIAAGTWRQLGETTAFNWQQGAMLQWVGAPQSQDVIFNTESSGNYYSRRVNLRDGRTSELPRAVYAVRPQGDVALCVRFERHRFCRAYHYECQPHEHWNLPVHPDDGIDVMDLATGAVRQLLRTSQFTARRYEDTTPHWLEHLQWNPAGSHFVFLHRWGYGEAFQTEAYVSNVDGKVAGPTPRRFEISHTGWESEDAILAYVREFGRFAAVARGAAQQRMRGRSILIRRAKTAGWAAVRFVKRSLPLSVQPRWEAGSGYTRFSLSESCLEANGLVGQPSPPLDGHPSFLKKNGWYLSDTYADTFGYRWLYVANPNDGRVCYLAALRSPLNGCSYRCDLHPRLSADESRVVVDSADSGRRQILVLQVSWGVILESAALS